MAIEAGFEVEHGVQREELEVVVVGRIGGGGLGPK